MAQIDINLIRMKIDFRYGEPCPHFYEGSLEEALREACHKPAKDVIIANTCFHTFPQTFFQSNFLTHHN